MGNKERLQVNNTDLQNILTTINNLPEGGGTEVYIYENGDRVDNDSFYDLNLNTKLTSTYINRHDTYTYLSGVVYYNNEIHILGGVERTKKHTKFTSMCDKVELNDLPYDFSYSSAVVYNNEIHILGSNSDVPSNMVKHYKWNSSNDTWTSVSVLPFVHDNTSGAIVKDGCIHLLGTYSGNYEHYKWNGTDWTKLTDLPVYLYNMGRCTFLDEDNKLYFMTRDKQLFMMNDDGTYTGILLNLPSPWSDSGNNLSYCNIFYHEGKIYILGCSTNTTKFRTHYYIYDLKNSKRVGVGKISNGLYWAGACMKDNGEIICDYGYDVFMLYESLEAYFNY